MITIELGVDRKLLLDMLSDGMDYVCRGYWAQIEEYRWRWWYAGSSDSDDYDTPSPDLTGDTVLIRLRDDEDGCAEDEDQPWVDITLNKLEDAFGWTLKHYPHTIEPYDVDKNNIITECSYDVTTADIMLQYICFGEVVYG
jgi:hypothetical protein